VPHPDERGRVEVDHCVLASRRVVHGGRPIISAATHEQLPYAIARYTDEVNRPM
jgi:hypothetical protein